jgi:predicted house-cleaning noncanonical NTP pyrophosphatase (MazG superfamily)
MANLIDMTSSILSQNIFCFDDRNINSEQIPVPMEGDTKFGVLNFTAVTSKETLNELDFLFIVDCSYSMSDMCSDNKTKMQHIIHTLKNMILFFNEHPNVKINITINAFDVEIYPIVSRTKITRDNLREIILKVERIVPLGSTNIELALRKSREEINRLVTEFPHTIVNHVFMTDGESVEGTKNITILQSLVVPTVTNAFVGFGIEHDAALLNGLSSVGKSAYYFIDKLESAGLVYGEILHGIIYNLLTNVEITIENGFIYNYKTNTWVNSLEIGDIVSEANKTYNIISSTPDECRINITGSMDGLVMSFPSTIAENTDLSIHAYRQRTLQILYDVNQYCIVKQKPLDFSNSLLHVQDIHFADEQEHREKLGTELANLIEEIKKYMADNTLEDNKILKNLCDDIYICYRTFGTKFGTMYCTARQTSQGSQRQYTASESSTVDLYQQAIPVLQRHTRQRPVEPFPYQIDLSILQHNVSDFIETPYLTPQASQVMREISRSV